MRASMPAAAAGPLGGWWSRPASAELEPDVAAASTRRRLRRSSLVDAPPPERSSTSPSTFLEVICTACSSATAGSATVGSSTAPRSAASSIRRGAGVTASSTSRVQERRAETGVLADWLAEHRIDAVSSPPCRWSRPRGHGYDEAFTDFAEISLTHYWDWTGFPVVAMPSGLGRRRGCRRGLADRPGRSDWDLLAAGVALQSRLDSPSL